MRSGGRWATIYIAILSSVILTFTLFLWFLKLLCQFVSTRCHSGLDNSFLSLVILYLIFIGYCYWPFCHPYLYWVLNWRFHHQSHYVLHIFNSLLQLILFLVSFSSYLFMYCENCPNSLSHSLFYRQLPRKLIRVISFMTAIYQIRRKIATIFYIIFVPSNPWLFIGLPTLAALIRLLYHQFYFFLLIASILSRAA